LQSHVHNRDIPAGVTVFFSVALRIFQRDVATDVSVHCALAVVRTFCPNKNPGIAAGVLHFLNIA
jgi:hypothetical protein